MRGEGWDLRTRLVAIVAAAMVPVALIGVFQALERRRLDRDAGEMRLLARAQLVAESELRLFLGVEMMLDALAAQPLSAQGGPACSTMLKAAAGGVPKILNIAVTTPEGDVTCSAKAPPRQSYVSWNEEWLKAAMATDRLHVFGPLYGAMSKTQILIASKPVGVAGARTGTISAAISHEWVVETLKTQAARNADVLAIVNASGAVVAASQAERAAAIAGQIGFAPAAEGAGVVEIEGVKWRYVAAPLVEDHLWIVAAAGARAPEAIAPFIAEMSGPLLTLFLAALAIWLWTDRMITRRVLQLRQAAVGFGKGKYDMTISGLEGAPGELRSLGESMNAMAAAVAERDQALRQAIDQKTSLLREIHHRVKNNLQIVTSLLSLQSQSETDPDAIEALARASIRINALATVHRLLYETDDRDAVDVAKLLEALCRQINDALGLRDNIALSCRAEPLVLATDIAGPLALLAVEGITNAYRYAFPDKRRGRIAVRLTRHENRAILSIEDDGVGGAPGGTGLKDSTGMSLMSAFARQLSGDLRLSAPAGGGACVEIEFPTDKQRDAPII